MILFPHGGAQLAPGVYARARRDGGPFAVRGAVLRVSGRRPVTGEIALILKRLSSGEDRWLMLTA